MQFSWRDLPDTHTLELQAEPQVVICVQNGTDKCTLEDAGYLIVTSIDVISFDNSKSNPPMSIDGQADDTRVTQS